MPVNFSSYFVLRGLALKIYHLLFFLLFLTYSLLGGEGRVVSILIAAALLALIFFFILRKRWVWSIGGNNYLILWVVLGLFLLFFVGQFLWVHNSHSFVVYAPVAIILMLTFTDREMVEKVLFIAVFWIVLLAVIEKLTGSYIFVVESSMPVYGGETGVALDEEFFAGAAGLLRAKSIFFGPLTLSAFLIGAAIVLRKDKLALGLCLLGVTMAISRTGMFLVFLIFLVMIFHVRGNGINRWFRIFILLLSLIMSASIFLVFNPDMISRLYDAFDFSGGSTTNSARLYFWSSAFFEISNYSATQLLFGENGYYRSVYNNNPESGWLALFLDFGFLGFSLYLAPLVYIFFKTTFLEIRLMVLVLFVANSVFTFSYGVVGCFMYWLVVYSLNNWRLRGCA